VKIPLDSGQHGYDLLLADKFQWFMSDECKSLQW
jgi:hypothetical protein